MTCSDMGRGYVIVGLIACCCVHIEVFTDLVLESVVRISPRGSNVRVHPPFVL